jgi:hypothetical protein
MYYILGNVCNATVTFYLGYDISITEYNRGRPLIDTLQYLLNKIGCDNSILTLFFYALENPLTAANPNPTGNLQILQKSDYKRPDSSEAAKEINISIKTLIDILCKMFNCAWYIDTTGNLIIEHIYYFENDLSYRIPRPYGLDLTTSDFESYVLNKNKYEYKNLEIPKQEIFEFMEAETIDFKGEPIEYESACATPEKITYSVQDVTTDLEYISKSPDKISDEGMVLLATEATATPGEYNLLYENGVITGLNLPNGHLSWANLHDTYWKYNRYMPTGLMNATETTFLSSKKLIQRIEIQVPECCISTFNPLYKVKTPYGDCFTEEAEYNLSTKTLKLKLIQ